MNTTRYLTVPNGLSVSRLLLLPLLYLLADRQTETAFVVAYAVVGATDYFDGLAARGLRQETSLGKALDSIMDIPFHLSSAWFLYRLHPEVLGPNAPLLIAFFATCAASFVVSAVRCHRPIMIHTFLLKLDGGLLYAAVILSRFVNTTLLVAAILVLCCVAFAEQIVIFLKHGEVDPESPSIFRVRARA
jgi:phosphatidylglycerophosphate synthase